MKYIKKFENNDSLEIGDYVLINTRKSPSDEYDEIEKKGKYFVDTHIGRCEEISNHEIPIIDVRYENIPEDIYSFFYVDKGKSGTRQYSISRVVVYGKTYEDVQMKINIMKYNL